MPSVEEGLLAAMGLKLVNVLAGAVTSFAALRFFDGLSTLEKWTTFMGGWAISAWGATPATMYFDLNPKVEVGVALLAGLFGMAVTAALMRGIKESNLLDLLFRRRDGGSKQ